MGGDADDVGLARDLEVTFAASPFSNFSVCYCFFILTPFKVQHSYNMGIILIFWSDSNLYIV